MTRPTDLDGAIASLEKAMGETRPKAVVPSAKVWATLEASVGSVHADLRALWSWGKVQSACSASQIEEERNESESYWSQEWLTPAQSLSTLREHRKTVQEFPDTYVPLSTDEAGNYSCFDNRSGKVMDWDHETRKTRTLDKSLAALLGRIEKAYLTAARRAKADAKQKADDAADKKKDAKTKATEAKKAPEAGTSKAASAATRVALPRSAKPVSTPILRKSEDRIEEFEAGVLSPDDRFAVLRKVNQTTTFLDLEHDTRQWPDFPEIMQAKVFGLADRPFTEGLAGEGVGPYFAVAGSDEIGIWRWGEKNAELVGRATWLDPKRKRPQFRFDGLRSCGRLFLTEEWVAVSLQPAVVTGPFSSTLGFEEHLAPVVAVWKRDAIPPSKSLTEKPPSVAPAHVVGSGLKDLLSFAMSGSRIVTSHQGADYFESVIRVWDLGSASPSATKTVKERAARVALSPDGRRVAFLGEKLSVLDSSLTTIAESKSKDSKDLGETLTFDPSGTFLVTASKTELVLWDAATAKPIVSTPIPDPRHKGGRRHFVQSVTERRILVVEPALVFAYK